MSTMLDAEGGSRPADGSRRFTITVKDGGEEATRGGYQVAELHGNLQQCQREEALSSTRQFDTNFDTISFVKS